MKSFIAACPACAAPVEFRVSATLVAICEFCRTVVGRGDKDPDDHGKVADLVQTRSPLELGLRGTFKRTSFELVGRVQYAHTAGGVWDEWYLLFSGSKVGWLAESQGRFHLTMAKPLQGGRTLPSYDQVEVGNSWDFGKSIGTLTVAEKGTAKAVSAEGQIPWAFRPGALHVFADLQGESGAFGTIEFTDDDQRLFLGREVTLDELRIPLVDSDKGVRRTTGKQVNCPHCGGTLTLVAPDQAQRVTCSNCSSLLDVDQGNLRYLKTISKRNQQPVIPLGTKGTIRGIEYTVIGFMERFVVHEGTKYPWTEYLLYEPRTGFRWLVHSEHHWNFVEPISAGEVSRSALNARYHGDDYRLFQHGSARVRHVLGEFYWRVEAGEKVRTKDYVCPPRMLSIETAEHDQSGEMNVSLGTYMPVDEVESAFGVTGLARPWSPGPNQPSPQTGAIFRTWSIFLLVLILMDVVFVNAWITPRLDQWLFSYAVIFVSIVPVGALLYNLSFERQRWSQSDYSPYATDSE
jgi:hypothetical protein